MEKVLGYLTITKPLPAAHAAREFLAVSRMFAGIDAAREFLSFIATRGPANRETRRSVCDTSFLEEGIISLDLPERSSQVGKCENLAILARDVR
jgi:hypothetical protein